MKLLEVVTLPLIFYRDNPGGEWLKSKRESNAYDTQRTEFGTPKYFGSVTGSFDRVAMLPVKVLKDLKGRRGEHTPRYTREESLNWLVAYMREHNSLPLRENGEQYFPFLNIDERGIPWINEGNHRIKAAALLGWKCMPCQISYFSGGEDEPGPFPPAKVKAYDAHAASLGYDVTNFKGILPTQGE